MYFDFGFAKEVFFAALSGIPVTLVLTFVPLILAIPLAFLIAFLRINRVKFFSQIAVIFVSFMRGTPEIVQIFLIYYSMPGFLVKLFAILHLEIKIYKVSPIIYAIIIFTLGTAAYLSETFRAALKAINKGQKEAALSVGMSVPQGYFNIIFPQMFKISLPNICSTSVNLLKGTSLVYLMTVQDITAKAKIMAANSYKYIEAYVVIFFIYILLCPVLEKTFRLQERKFAWQEKAFKAKNIFKL